MYFAFANEAFPAIEERYDEAGSVHFQEFQNEDLLEAELEA